MAFYGARDKIASRIYGRCPRQMNVRNALGIVVFLVQPAVTNKDNYVKTQPCSNMLHDILRRLDSAFVLEITNGIEKYSTAD